MQGESYTNHISAMLKEHDHPFITYGHFSDPTLQMYIRTKKYVFFSVILTGTCLVLNIIVAIDPGRTY